MEKLKTSTDLPVLAYQVKDIQKILGISKELAYQMVHSEGFPKIILGERRIIIPAEPFKKWLEENTVYGVV